MAHALGMEVVAGGVENAEQLAILRTLGCNEVQGYLVARPMPAGAMAALLAQRWLFGEKLGGLVVIPAQAGIQGQLALPKRAQTWVPTCAGMT